MHHLDSQWWLCMQRVRNHFNRSHSLDWHVPHWFGVLMMLNSAHGMQRHGMMYCIKGWGSEFLCLPQLTVRFKKESWGWANQTNCINMCHSLTTTIRICDKKRKWMEDTSSRCIFADLCKISLFKWNKYFFVFFYQLKKNVQSFPDNVCVHGLLMYLS